MADAPQEQPQRDNRSTIHKQFDAIAARCVARLRQLSDDGLGVWPIHIAEVQDEIVKELGNLYFNGLPDDAAPTSKG